MEHCEIDNIDYEGIYHDAFGKKMLIGGCPECEKRGNARRDEEEKEHKRYQIESLLLSGRVEPAYFNTTFDTFLAPTDELKHNLETVKRLVSGEIQQIVMTGRNGTGKTHLAISALRELGGKIYTMYEIATRIRASYLYNAGETELKIVDELAHTNLLIIDELGRTKGSDAETNWLSYIIDKRHVRNLPTILISNKHTRKDCKAGGCTDCLENYISEDIMSRISENGVLLRFTGEDYRKKAKA